MRKEGLAYGLVVVVRTALFGEMAENSRLCFPDWGILDRDVRDFFFFFGSEGVEDEGLVPI